MQSNFVLIFEFMNVKFDELVGSPVGRQSCSPKLRVIGLPEPLRETAARRAPLTRSAGGQVPPQRAAWTCAPRPASRTGGPAREIPREPPSRRADGEYACACRGGK